MYIQDVLGVLPETLRKELLAAFNAVIINYRESRWEPSELNAGKLCEVIYTILAGYINQKTYPNRATKPQNMVAACQQLERTEPDLPRTVRIQMPRVLITLYEFRNNRGVGHIGGDVNPNHMDATMIFYASKWLMAELVRLLHNVETREASAIVEDLISKEIPLVWQAGDRKRILAKNLNMRQKTLLFLYSESQPIKEDTLFDWIEHSNKAVFRNNVLVRGHRARLWEYDKSSRTVLLSPIGKDEVETNLL